MNANGDLTVDFRSDIAAESRAKIIYEYLMKFTDDPLVHESLRFLMTREITHFQQFTAALDTIQPNFPVGVLQGDPRYTHVTFNMSDTVSATGPWNEGQGPWPEGERWNHVEDPIAEVRRTMGLTEMEPEGTQLSEREVQKLNQKMSKQRHQENRLKRFLKAKTRWSVKYQTWSPRGSGRQVRSGMGAPGVQGFGRVSC